MFLKSITAAALLGVVALPAAAQNYMPNTAQAIYDVARGFGPAQLEPPDGEGRPVVTGSIEGTNYGILIYGCEGNVGCESVQFFASFEPTAQSDLAWLNAWNADKRYAAAYVEDDGDIILHFNANIDFGVSNDNFVDTFDIWSLLLGQFTDRLYGGGGDGK